MDHVRIIQNKEIKRCLMCILCSSSINSSFTDDSAYLTIFIPVRTESTYLARLHLPDGRFDLANSLVLQAGLQRPAALVVSVERGLRSGALGLQGERDTIITHDLGKIRSKQRFLTYQVMREKIPTLTTIVLKYRCYRMANVCQYTCHYNTICMYVLIVYFLNDPIPMKYEIPTLSEGAWYTTLPRHSPPSFSMNGWGSVNFLQNTQQCKVILYHPSQ